MGRQHNGTSCFAGTIFCECCGGMYGSKVWHSNSKYRRVIWHCNAKFKDGYHCDTPHLTETVIQEKFLNAFNQLIDQRDFIAKDIKIIVDFLTDTKTLKSEAAELRGEMEIVTELMKQAIAQNASMAMDQEEYAARYNALAERFQTAADRYKAIEAEFANRASQRKMLTSFAKQLMASNEQVIEFTPAIWNAMVEKVTVDTDGMKNKHLITAVIALAASIAVMIISGMNYLAAREVPMPIAGENTEIHMLSEWFNGLEGTNGDAPVYVIKGEKEGGSMLVLGGTHANEPSGYMSAITFIETAKVETGTVCVIPYTNYSSMTHNDPGEGNHQYFTIETQSGERSFRFGSRATNPVDQWPDPDVYVHYPSGQELSGSETRNINRAYPGREDGNLTEQMAYGVTQLINTEGIDITFDLHEASPEYPVINATVAHQDAMDLASDGCISILASGIEMALEQSPTNFHGLTHRELGDFTDIYALLMETANAAQGRLRGATTQEQILGGDDDCYLYSKDLGMLYVPWDETGHPIEERCGRHLQGIYEYSQAYNRLHPEAMVEYSNVPGYAELFLDVPAEDLGGTQLGKFLK